MPEPSDRDREVLTAYVRTLGDQLGLRDWDIWLGDWLPPADDKKAEYTPTPGDRHTYINFASDIREWSLEKLRSIVVHELVHLHLCDLGEIVRSDIHDAHLIRQQEYELIWAAFYRARELAVNGISRAIAGFFPLIEWERAPDALDCADPLLPGNAILSIEHPM